ncbi:hypothetical protein AAMO2058_000186700 [Amorphochlora amoebiformis]
MLHGMGIGTEEIRSTGSRFVFYRSSMLVSNVGDTRMRNVLPVWEQSAVQSRAGETNRKRICPPRNPKQYWWYRRQHPEAIQRAIVEQSSSAIRQLQWQGYHQKKGRYVQTKRHQSAYEGSANDVQEVEPVFMKSLQPTETTERLFTSHAI